MQELIRVLTVWASVLTGYPSAVPPVVELKPHSFFVENACLGRPCRVIAWYNDTGTVYFDEAVSVDARDDVLLHEIVHYLQDLSGKFDSLSCADRVTREREAYRAQSQYLVLMGRLAFVMPPPMVCP